ncbi:hypothetical protein VTO42DRAFT_3705 [Malbranchea cinnamomea]
MKTSIPSDVWETKRAQIAVLYKEEEWPLKQVIKRIRSEDFNPTETQLRSRLKKWGVTKPSRQRRKKPSSDQRAASPTHNLDQAGMRKKNENVFQLPSLHVPTAFFNEPMWTKHRQTTSMIDQPYHTQNASLPRGNRVGPIWDPMNDLLQHTQRESGPRYSFSSLPQDVFQTPAFRSLGAQLPSIGGPVKHDDPRGGYLAHPRNISSRSIVSPRASLTSDVSAGWLLQGNQTEAESKSSISPASPWSCTPPETGHMCSPTSLYLAESVPLSPNYHYDKQVLPENTQKYDHFQSLPSPELKILDESMPGLRAWRRTSTSSEPNIASKCFPMDHTPSCQQRRDEKCMGGCEQSLLSHRSLPGTQIQSPVLIPELTSSSSESDTQFQDMSPIDGASFEYLLPSPDIH